MNISPMKKREFKECVERLIDREAVSVDVQNKPNRAPNLYILEGSIMET
jgi:hypothetical protein